MSAAIAATAGMSRRATSDEQRARAKRVHQRLQEALDHSVSHTGGLARESHVDWRTLDDHLGSDSRSPLFFSTVDIARVLDVSLEELPFGQEADQ